MRFVSVICIFVLAVVAIATAYPSNRKPHYDLRDAPALFEKFIRDYNRHYKDEEDYYAHYYAFFMNLIQINKLNEEDNSPSSAVFDIGIFADQTEEEREKILGPPGPHRKSYFKKQTHTYINSRLSPMGIDRNYRTLPATLSLHTPLASSTCIHPVIHARRLC